MKKLTLITLFSLCCITASHGQLLVGVSADLIKSDFIGFGEKAQVGIELNYFLSESFTISAGYDYWTPLSNFVLGVRYYPSNPIFVRARGLLGTDDFSLGIGGTLPITDRLRAEIVADYYILESDVALRGGIAYYIGNLE